MRSTAIIASLGLLGCRFGFNQRPDGGGDDAATGEPDGPPVVDAPRAITVGRDFACTVRDGAVWCWGDDHTGQLGDNGTTPRSRPVKVVGITDAVSVAAGESHACALRAGGGVSCWGENDSGQVGTADDRDQRVPVAIAGLGTATAIATGAQHSCARLADATAWCWGNNDSHQLGYTGDASPSPIKVLDDVAAIAAGEAHTCALRSGGRVWCWGDNLNGQLGDGTRMNDRPDAMPVATGLIASALALAGNTSCALSAGHYWCWGANDDGQLGNGDDSGADQLTPEMASRTDGITAIGAAADHVCAVSAGNVLCWGDGGTGQLGNGGRRSSPSPVIALADGRAVAVAAGKDLSCALRGDGSIACWGLGSSGQLGDGTLATWQPQPVVDLVGATVVATGARHSCAIIDPNRAVWCWGADEDAQLGDRSGAPQDRPVFANVVGAVQLALGEDHSCALLMDSTVWCWGDGGDGQVGNGMDNSSNLPGPVMNLTGVAAVAAGDSFTCAVKSSDGSAFCWGYDGDGELGDAVGGAGGASQLVPKQVAGITGATLIAAGHRHACAGSAAGIKCWGDGSRGQLGNGDEPEISAPVAVIGAGTGLGTMWTPSKLAAGAAHTCALDTLNTLRCWGRDDSGALGDDGSGSQPVPVATKLIGMTARDVSAGDDLTCAQTTAGPRCWGNNYDGQIGDGTTDERSVPATVKTLPAGAKPVAGGQHTCAVVGGQVLCWGDNALGQLGNGTVSASLLPTEVDLSQAP